MKEQSISQNELTANTGQTLLWLVFSTLSTLLFPGLLGIGIYNKILLIKYFVAVATIVSFVLFVFFLANYLNKLLTAGSNNQTKKEFYLKSFIIFLSGIVLIFSFILLKSVSNSSNLFLIILTFLPLEIYIQTKNIKQLRLVFLKLIKIILLLTYPLLFFKFKISLPLIISFLAWMSLFFGKFVSELFYVSEKNKNKTFKLCIFSLITSPLLFGFLVAMQYLPKIFTITNLSIFFIVYMLNKKDVVNKHDKFVKHVNYFVYIQVGLIIFTNVLK